MIKFKIYEENNRQMIERLIYPRFKGEITFSSDFPSDIENVEWIDEMPDFMEVARIMRAAGEFIIKGHQIK